MKIELPDYIKTAINNLSRGGFKAYAVGGCVRDSIMGNIPHDWDLCTDALPDEVIATFSEYKAIGTGLKHGTVTVVIDDMPVEITTFRIDGVYSDSRRPDSVKFVRSLKEDISRRDFTINAIAYSDTEGLIDLFCGKEDIENRLIRCVGEPEKRFSEDALRIMRALRFSSCLGFFIEEKTSLAIIENKKLIDSVAPERISVELDKLLLGDNVAEVMRKYREVIAQIIPEIKPCFDFSQKNPHHSLDVYEHIIKSIASIPKDRILRLTMLLHDIGKPECFSVDEKGIGHFKGHQKVSAQIAKEVLRRLRYDNDTISLVTTLITEHDNRIPPEKKAVKRFLSKYGYEFFKLQTEIRRADCHAQSPMLLKQKLGQIDDVTKLAEEILAQGECFSIKDLKIKGDDLLKIGFIEGKDIGDVLNRLLDGVIVGEFENTEEVLIYKAKELR